VTITAAAGATPTINLQFRQTSPVAAWLILDHLTIQGGEISGPANNITVQNSTITDKVNIWQNANNSACSSCPAMNNSNIVFDNDLFNMSANQTGSGGYEARLNFVNAGGRDPSPAGVTVKNSQFTTGCADGVDILSGGYGVTIGPGNTFYNLLQGSCGPHIDSIQFVGSDDPGPTITGNYFHDDSTGVATYDYANQYIVTNNVFLNVGPNDALDAGTDAGGTSLVSHNTVVGSGYIGCGVTHQGNVCRAQIFDNITTSVTIGAGAAPSLDYNLCTLGKCAGGGTHNLSGTPTYVGGNPPSTYAGFQLTATSLGHAAGNDGTDLGANVSASSSSNKPVAPTNLAVSVQ